MKRKIKHSLTLLLILVVTFTLFIPQTKAANVDEWTYAVDSYKKAKGDFDDIIWDMNKKDFRLSGTTFEEDFTGYTKGSQFPNDTWSMAFTRSDYKKILSASYNSPHGNKQLRLIKSKTYNDNPQVRADFSPTKRGEIEFTVRPTSGHVRVGLIHTALQLDDDSRKTREFMVRFEPKRGSMPEGIRIGTNLGGNDPSRTAVHFVEEKIKWNTYYDVKLVWNLDSKSGIDVYINGKRVVQNFYSSMLKKQKDFNFYAVQLAVGTGSESSEGTLGNGLFDYVRFKETGKNKGTFTSSPLKIPNGIVVDNNSQSISWSQGTSSNSSARVQTSVSKDGGKSWTSWKTVSRGNPVPDIPQNTVLKNYQVKYRVTLERTSKSYNPWVRNIKFDFQNSDKEKPEHVSHSISGAYKSGDTYWVKPNNTVQVKLRGKDTSSFLERTNIRLLGVNNDVDVRSRYYYQNSTLDNYQKHSNIEVVSATKSYESSDKTIKETNFHVKPKVNNHVYEIATWLADFSGNTSGWVITPAQLATDGTLPTISFSSNGNSTYLRSHSTKVTVSDSQSGVGKTQYAWTTSTIQPSAGWKDFTNGGSLSAPTSTGNHYLWIKASDNVGNEKVIRSNVFKVDRNAPTGSISHSPTDHTNGNVKIAVSNLADSHSGYYRTKKPDGSYTTSTSFTYTVSDNGTYHFVVYDNAGNSKTLSVNIDNIDKEKPSVSFSPNGNSTYQQSHSTTVTVSDSGSGIKTSQYAWSTSNSTEPTNWTNFSSGNTLTTPSSDGNHYLWIKASDKAGNIKVLKSNVFRVDVTAPTHVSSSISGERYKSGKTYWVRPGDVLNVQFRQRDTLSGNQRGYIRVQGNSQDVRYFHSFGSSSTTHLSAVGSSFVNTSSVEVQGVKRTEHNTSNGYGTTEWEVKLNTSGHQYSVQYYHRDNASNNRGYVTVGTARVDGVAPNLSISPSTTSYTNKNITLTAKASDTLSGVKRIKKPNGSWVNASTATYTVSSNGTYTFVAEDNVGNQRTQIITISNIDKTAPTADLTQTPTSWTNGSVTLKLTNINDSGSGYYRTKLPDGSYVTNTSIDYTVTENGSYSFTIYDKVGNSTTKTIEVKNIDKVKPSASVTYSTTTGTNKNVIITVTTKDDASGVKSIRLPNGTEVNKPSVSYTVSKNGIFNFVINDHAGNAVTVTAKVENIDKTPPSLTLVASTESWTNDVIYITAIASDESGVKKIVLPNGSTVTNPKTVFEAKGNGTYIFTAYDTVDNKTTQLIEIKQFDSGKPELQIKKVNETKNGIEIKLEYGDK